MSYLVCLVVTISTSVRELADYSEKTSISLGMKNVLLNIMRHMALIPSGVVGYVYHMLIHELIHLYRKRTWKLLEFFVHRTIVIREEDDDDEDGTCSCN
jgi:hypothetical protein